MPHTTWSSATSEPKGFPTPSRWPTSEPCHETGELDNALAEAYEENHETERAIAALRRAIELNPENEDNYLDFANLCIDHRDFDNGLKVIAVGLNVLPNSSRLTFERGVLYAMQDRFDLAERTSNNR